MAAMAKTKVCCKCGIDKPRATAYHRKGHSPTGTPRIASNCKECERQIRSEARMSIAERFAISAARSAVLIENVEFMLTHREGLEMAAIRVGMKPDTLVRTLERAGRYDLPSALKANQFSTIANQKELY